MAYRLLYISFPVVLISFAVSCYMSIFDDASVDATDDFSMLQSKIDSMQSDQSGSLDEAALEQELVSIHEDQAQLKEQLEVLDQQESSIKQDLAESKNNDYGTQDCPCVGIEGLQGAFNVTLSNGSVALFPADLGARCSTWNVKNAPWAGSKMWCFVDPCNCKISPLPEPSTFLPGAEYQGHALYYSYAACDSMDPSTNNTNNTAGNDAVTKANDTINDICASSVDTATWGDLDCPCVGIAGQPGYLNMSIMGAITKFPADYGSKCTAWDKDNHPDCTTSNGKMPAWCKESWCYVDPCSCNVTLPPRASQMNDAEVVGKHVFWSYTTCGSQDKYSFWNGKTPCVDRNTSSNCSSAPGCAWTGTECLAKELVDACYGSSTSSEGGTSLVLPIAGGVVGFAAVAAILCYCMS